MTHFPPPMPMIDTRQTDIGHLRLLSVFHLVFAGVAALGLVFLFLHYTLMSHVMLNPQFLNAQKSNLPPTQMFGVFKWLYLFMAVIIVAVGIGNLLSGLFMLKRKNRLFSLIVSGFNCLSFPLGTALSVFTFIVLMRDSVQQVYQEGAIAK
jgi:hypothetical protein